MLYDVYDSGLFFLFFLRFKGELSFDYKGPRTKDAIIEFTNRVSG